LPGGPESLEIFFALFTIQLLSDLKRTEVKLEKCPYCGKESPRHRVSKCFYCSKEVGDEYIILIDEDGQRFGLCSAKCMDNLFEMMEAEEFEEDEG